jgi:hypothetical protein
MAKKERYGHKSVILAEFIPPRSVFQRFMAVCSSDREPTVVGCINCLKLA